MKKKYKFKQIYCTEYRDSTYIIGLCEDGSLVRALDNKKDNTITWEKLPSSSKYPITKR